MPTDQKRSHLTAEAVVVVCQKTIHRYYTLATSLRKLMCFPFIKAVLSDLC